MLNIMDYFEKIMMGINSPCAIDVRIYEIGGEYYFIKSVSDIDKSNWRTMDIISYHGKEAIC